MYLKKLNIGNIELENNILLAPMAGITDKAFRIICKKYGPGLEYTEMVSSKAIFYDDSKTKRLMNIDNEKRPIAIQIFGSDVETMGYAAKYVSNIADIVDINMGCPAPKVTKNGDGSKILLDLNLARSIMRAVVQNSTKPVTLKIRKGWDNEHIVAKDVAKIAEEEGISAITVHGRTRNEFYSGNADWNIIKEVKQTVNIPVIGNGDIVDEETAYKMFEETNVDGIMIGRATLGNPWIFEKIIYYLQNGKKLGDKTSLEKLDVIKEHLTLEMQEKGELTGIKEFRKHLSAYTKNMPNSSEFRGKINKIEDKNNLIDMIEDYFKKGI